MRFFKFYYDVCACFDLIYRLNLLQSSTILRLFEYYLFSVFTSSLRIILSKTKIIFVKSCPILSSVQFGLSLFPYLQVLKMVMLHSHGYLNMKLSETATGLCSIAWPNDTQEGNANDVKSTMSNWKDLVKKKVKKNHLSCFVACTSMFCCSFSSVHWVPYLCWASFWFVTKMS